MTNITEGGRGLGARLLRVLVYTPCKKKRHTCRETNNTERDMIVATRTVKLRGATVGTLPTVAPVKGNRKSNNY